MSTISRSVKAATGDTRIRPRNTNGLITDAPLACAGRGARFRGRSEHGLSTACEAVRFISRGTMLPVYCRLWI